MFIAIDQHRSVNTNHILYYEIQRFGEESILTVHLIGGEHLSVTGELDVLRSIAMRITGSQLRK